VVEETQEQDNSSSEEELYEHHQFTVDPGQSPLRIDKYLMHKIQNASRTKLQAAMRNNSVLVDDKPVKPNFKVKPNQEISIVLPYPPRDTTVHPEELDIEYVYQDDDLAIINKQSGIVVHPGLNNYTGTLLHGLLYDFNKTILPDIKITPQLAHRIDKNTSGLLVVAKHEDCLAHLANQFYHHTIERKYLALVWGNFEEDHGTIEAPLARDNKDRRKRSVPANPELGKHAITHYKVLENFHFCSLIECKLETGRTHQIRAHMAHIGHPIFADERYGGDKIWKGSRHAKFKQFIDNCFKIIPRQALHAQVLGFEHPKTKKEVYFEAELPSDFTLVLEKIRDYVTNNTL